MPLLVDAVTAENNEIEITVFPHDCEPTESRVDLSTALMALTDNEMVEVGYYRKDGAFTTMRGFFSRGQGGLAKLGYEMFLKEVEDGFAPRNLIRRSITSIYRENTEFTFVIG